VPKDRRQPLVTSMTYSLHPVLSLTMLRRSYNDSLVLPTTLLYVTCLFHLLFSDLPGDCPDADLFKACGIDVLNVAGFMRGFISKNVEHPTIPIPRMLCPSLVLFKLSNVTVRSFLPSAPGTGAHFMKRLMWRSGL